MVPPPFTGKTCGTDFIPVRAITGAPVTPYLLLNQRRWLGGGNIITRSSGVGQTGQNGCMLEYIRGIFCYNATRGKDGGVSGCPTMPTK